MPHVTSTGAVDRASPPGGQRAVLDAGRPGVPAIVRDAGTGVIVAWDDRNGSNHDIYAQHILASGSVDGAWPLDGRVRYTEPQRRSVVTDLRRVRDRLSS